MRKHSLLVSLIAASFFVGAGRAQEPKLPDGLRHVPGDALGFVHIRAGDFLKSPAGIALLSELQQDREAKKGLQEIESKLGIKALDLESVTVLMLVPPNGPMQRRWDVPRYKASPRDFDAPKVMPLPPPPVTPKDEKKAAVKESPVLFQEFKALPPQVRQQFGEVMPFIEQEFMDGGDPFAFAGPLVIVTSTKDLDRKKIMKANLLEQRPRDPFSAPNETGVLFLTDRTVMVGMPASLAHYSEMMARNPAPKSQPLKSALALGVESHLVVAGGHMPAAVRRMVMQPFSPESRLFATVAPLLQSEAGMTLDLGKSIDLTLQFQAANEATADSTLHAAKTLRVLAELALEKSREAGESGGWKLELEKGLAKALADANIELKGTTVRVEVKMDVTPTLVKRFTKEIVVGLRSKGDRVQSQNNLKQIGLALHNYHDTNKSLPPAGISSFKNNNGKALLSWRVAILPYIDQGELYRQFDLDQPWDHPTNKKLIAKMPAIYMIPGADNKEGMTHYRGLVGPGTIFEGRNQGGRIVGSRLVQITDGTSNTIMVVEANDPTTWTRPDDLPYDPNGPLPKFGVSPEGFNVLIADGSVRFVRGNINPDVLRVWLTGNNGNLRGPLD